MSNLLRIADEHGGIAFHVELSQSHNVMLIYERDAGKDWANGDAMVNHLVAVGRSLTLIQTHRQINGLQTASSSRLFSGHAC